MDVFMFKENQSSTLVKVLKDGKKNKKCETNLF